MPHGCLGQQPHSETICARGEGFITRGSMFIGTARGNAVICLITSQDVYLFSQHGIDSHSVMEGVNLV